MDRQVDLCCLHADLPSHLCMYLSCKLLGFILSFTAELNQHLVTAVMLTAAFLVAVLHAGMSSWTPDIEELA